MLLSNHDAAKDLSLTYSTFWRRNVAAPASHDDRSRDRYRRALLASAAAVFAKGVGMMATLLTIPVTAPYLGAERFGLFMTLSSIPVLLSFADFGLGNGLLTSLAGAHGRGEELESRSLVSSAFYLLLAIAAGVIGLFATIYRSVPWAHVFNVTDPRAIAESGPAVAVFLVLIAVNIPLNVVQRAQMALQEGFTCNLWLGIGNLLSFALLLVFVHLGLGLPWLVMAVAGGPVAAGIANWAVYFGRTRPSLRPRWRDRSREAMSAIGSSGLLIFSCQLGAAVLLSAPPFLLAQKAGPSAVASYAILQRIFSVFVVASGLLMTPLWPAYGEAYSKREMGWIRGAFLRSLMANLLVAGVPVFIAALLSPRLVPMFSSNRVHAGWALAFATAALSFLAATRHAISMLVNGCGFLRRASIVFPLAALFTASLVLWRRANLPSYAVPLWVAGAECLVIIVLLTDTARIFSRATEAEPALCAAEACR